MIMWKRSNISMRSSCSSSCILNNCINLSTIPKQVVFDDTVENSVHSSLRWCQSSVLSGPPELNWLLSRLKPFKTGLPCSSSTLLHQPTDSQTCYTEELILMGSDRREVWARRWGSSQSRLVSQKSAGWFPACPKPTVTHIAPSFLCFIFVGVWINSKVPGGLSKFPWLYIWMLPLLSSEG